MRVTLFEMSNGDCPYLPNRTWVTRSFRANEVPEELYEQLLNHGWRRSGSIFYHNNCPGCNLCIPIRVPVERFAPSKSQRKVLRKNRDVTIERHEAHTRSELVELFRRYDMERHDPDSDISEESFDRFLGSSPIQTDVMEYRVGDRLVGAGWLDILPEGLSTVYFAFEPAEHKRSLGTFSALKEIELCQELGKPWYYLGYFVPGSPKMSYKTRFRPYQLLMDGEWRDYGTQPPAGTERS
jgi:arginine-tRNA-protein transferase